MLYLNRIKHHKELDGKSTAIHARIIAENDVDLHTWPEVPEYEYPERTLLLFPGPVSRAKWLIIKSDLFSLNKFSL